MRTELYPQTKTTLLAEDFCQSVPKVMEFFTYSVADESRWQRRVEWLDQTAALQTDRHKMVNFLLSYNGKMANSQEAMRNIERLRADEALVVIGGQQTGLFTGPLLVIYKVLSIIQSAQYAEKQLHRPVIPVFWMAGEDHDFAEVDHTFALTPQLEIAKIKLDHHSELRSTVSQTFISGWDDVLQQLDDAMMPTEFKAGIMKKLLDIGRMSSTLVDFFAHVLIWLFGKYGLVLLDSADPQLRSLESPMFRLLLDKHEEINATLLAAKDKVVAFGYIPQTEIAANQVNLFHLSDSGERILLQWDGALFYDKKHERTFRQEELAEQTISSPQRFSNNVMTRPLMQEYLFPVLATVLGPGEISYWGLTKSAFAKLNMEMPIIIPRAEYTLVEGTMQKQLDKFDLSIDTVMNHFDLWKQKWLETHDPLGLPGRFAEVKQQFQRLYEPLLEVVSHINPGMQKLGVANYQKIMEQIEFLENRSVAANESQFAAAVHQLERVRLSLAPFGKPQERVYNIFSYLNKYGVDWLDQFFELPFLMKGEHAIVYI